MIVERATDDDLAEVLEIETLTMGDDRRIDYLTEAVKRHQCYVARDGERVLGFAVLSKSFFNHYLFELTVFCPAQWRESATIALIQYIEKTLPEDKLFTSTNQSNTPMQALAEKLGFVKSGWIDNLDEGDPEIIYFKRLQKPS